MTPLVHVTLRALAVLRGENTADECVSPLFRLACSPHLSHRDARYIGAGDLMSDYPRPSNRVPTCPVCAVAWDEALEGRK